MEYDLRQRWNFEEGHFLFPYIYLELEHPLIFGRFTRRNQVRVNATYIDQKKKDIVIMIMEKWPIVCFVYFQPLSHSQECSVH